MFMGVLTHRNLPETLEGHQSEGGDARTGYEASRAHGLSGLACAGDLVVVVSRGRARCSNGVLVIY